METVMTDSRDNKQDNIVIYQTRGLQGNEG
jgi:hypothetical protein